MRRWVVLFAVVVVAAAAVYVLQPSVRVRSQCRYMRSEEECACYEVCVYRNVVGNEQMYAPPYAAPYCPAVDVFPVYSYTPEKRLGRTPVVGEHPEDVFSKDPCVNPDAVFERDEPPRVPDGAPKP